MGAVLSTTAVIGKNGQHDDLISLNQLISHRPESLENLCRETDFTKAELRQLYRSFKQECPNGYLTEDKFLEIFSLFFPHGDSSQYGRLIFRMFDSERSGSIDFEKYIHGLRVLLRGALADRSRWIFNLYDVNGDGKVTREELQYVVSSIYSLIGSYSTGTVSSSPNSSSSGNKQQLGDVEMDATQHANNVFQRLDVNGDGVITLEEFVTVCTTDLQMKTSFSAMDY